MQNILTVEQLDTMAAQIEATKLSLVAREESRENLEARKERFIAQHQSEWKETGSHYRALRISKGLSQESVAEALGVSASKISNFENGKSITHAKLVAKSYKMFLAIHQEVCNIETIEDYASSVIGNIEELVRDCEPKERPATLRAVKILSDYLFNVQVRLAPQKPCLAMVRRNKVQH